MVAICHLQSWYSMRFHPKRILHFVLAIWLLSSGAFYLWSKFQTTTSDDSQIPGRIDRRVVSLPDPSGNKQLSNETGKGLAKPVIDAVDHKQTPVPLKPEIGKEPGVREARELVKNFVEEQLPDSADLGKGVDPPNGKQRFLPLNINDSLAGTRDELIYPSLEHYSEDRITQQLKFVAPSVRRQRQQGSVEVKTIRVYPSVRSWSLSDAGRQRFEDDQCAVRDCEIVDDTDPRQADVVLTKGHHGDPSRRPREQVWVLFLLESPYHTPAFANERPGLFNWTATYRHDSTLVAPYEKYVPLNASLVTRAPIRNYAEGKTKKVAWFVSNCGAQNQRLEYARELGQHIQVDIYGGCGDLHCPRFQDSCFHMLDQDYKFYLAFENSNCRDYITEKFFINGLQHDVIPIVMGAHPDDYKRAAPPNSFIHVDHFESPKHLADYLHQLDKDDQLFNQYFTWKGLWTNINTFFWCRLCQLAHDVEDRGPSWFEDVDKWWRGPGVCTKNRHWWPLDQTPKVIADLAVEAGKT